MLLERQSPLASLAGYAREAAAGDGRLVLVAGEAGVGKSALVEQLQVDLRHARWSWGACDGLFVPRPLGPLFDLATQLGGELAELCRARAPREELFYALLRALAKPGTLDVIVIEDVHWADEATIDLLRFLGRRVRTTSALVVVSYRDDALTPTDPLRLALGELATHRSTRRVGLAPLSEEAVRVLAGDCGIEPAELYRLTGGNPFYVTEVVRAGSGEMPPSARDAVLARAARLDAGAREVLDAAALIGTRVELPLLESVTGCSPVQLDAVLASGLVTGDGDWLRFRHEIGRLAVEQAIAVHRRIPVHVRILAGLREMGCDEDARMAYHAEAADDGPATLDFAAAAAKRAAELGSHREAAAQYRRALRSAEGVESARAAQLYFGLGNEAALIDRWEEAAEARQRALTLYQAIGDVLREGDTHRLLAGTMWRLCRGRESVDEARAAVRILEPLGPSTELAWAYANLAYAADATALEMVRRARSMAEALDLPPLICETLNTEGYLAFRLGGDPIRLLREAIRIALDAGFVEPAGHAYANLHTILCSQRRFAEAEPYFVDGVAFCDQHDIDTYGTCLRGERTRSLVRMGRWDEAAALSNELLTLRSASPINQLNPLYSLATVLAHRGDPRAWSLIDTAVAWSDGDGGTEWIVEARLVRAEALWLEGRPDEAVREAELADDVADHGDPWERGQVASWLRRTGSERPARTDLAEPYRLQIDGDWRRAAQLWSELGCPYEMAYTLVDADDQEALRRALETFQDLGSPAGVRVVRQRMRDLGMRSIPKGPQAATRAHPLGLTRREQEVLDLICVGYTNAEIAARLVISARTVDHHVSAVLAKLGTPTRSAAASVAARIG